MIHILNFCCQTTGDLIDSHSFLVIIILVGLYLISASKQNNILIEINIRANNISHSIIINVIVNNRGWIYEPLVVQYLLRFEMQPIVSRK